MRDHLPSNNIRELVEDTATAIYETLLAESWLGVKVPSVDTVLRAIGNEVCRQHERHRDHSADIDMDLDR